MKDIGIDPLGVINSNEWRLENNRKRAMRAAETIEKLKEELRLRIINDKKGGVGIAS